MLLVHYVPEGKSNLCTASLVAPRLILTARHCVIDTPDPSTRVSCMADGRQLSGPKIRGDVPATDLYVFTGSTRSPDTLPLSKVDPSKWRPASRGARIFDDGSTVLCDHDLALVLLDTPITNVPIAKLRLESDVTVGERVVAVGYGVTSTVEEPAIRQQRAVTIRFSGPHDSSPFLTANEVGFGSSICGGDSGGPLFAERSGAIVGVISRGDPQCETGDNIGTKLRPFESLIANAFNAAGATPQLEDWQPSGCN